MYSRECIQSGCSQMGENGLFKDTLIIQPRMEIANYPNGGGEGLRG